MTKKNVTEQMIIDTLRAVVEENPSYVYPSSILDEYNHTRADDYHREGGSCVYATPDGKPACLIGHVIYRLDPEKLPPYDTPSETASDVMSELFPEATNDALCYALDEAQGTQDLGGSWVSAWEAFKEGYDRA